MECFSVSTVLFPHNLKAIKIQNNIGHHWLSLRGQKDIFQNVSKKIIHVWNYKNRHALPEWQHLFGCENIFITVTRGTLRSLMETPYMTHIQNISLFLSTPTPPFPTKSLVFSQAHSHKISFLHRAGETDLWLEMRKRVSKGKKKKELVKETIREWGKPWCCNVSWYFYFIYSISLFCHVNPNKTLPFHYTHTHTHTHTRLLVWSDFFPCQF